MPDQPANKPMIPFDPLTGKTSSEIPETPSVSKLRELVLQKTKLEFIRVVSRTNDQRMLLQDVKQQCVALEKPVVLEGIETHLASRQQEIQKLEAYLKFTAPKRGMRMVESTQKRRMAARAAISKLQAEIIPFEQAKAEVDGVAKMTELEMMNRCQFLQMVGMGMLALTIWNEAVAEWHMAVDPIYGSGSLASVSGTYSSGSSCYIGDGPIGRDGTNNDDRCPTTQNWAFQSENIMQLQNRAEWCEFAVISSLSSSSLIGYNTSTLRQCDLASIYHNARYLPFGTLECCDNTLISPLGWICDGGVMYRFDYVAILLDSIGGMMNGPRIEGLPANEIVRGDLSVTEGHPIRNPIILTIDSSDVPLGPTCYHSIMLWSIGVNFKWTRPEYSTTEIIDSVEYVTDHPEKRMTIALAEIYCPMFGRRWGYLCPEESIILCPTFVDPDWLLWGHDGYGKVPLYGGPFGRDVPVFRSYRTKP